MVQQSPISPDVPTLVSFAICPFVQRSAITMNAKGYAFKRVDIDLSDKPEWFLEKVPTGKVPALFVDGEVLFESAVINEYLDESFGTPLLSTDTLQRAKERAWISVAGDLLGVQYSLYSADNVQDYTDRKEALITGVLRLGKQAKGHYFNGSSMALIDTAIAPLFTRLVLVPSLLEEIRQRAQDSHLLAWIEQLVALPIVIKSVSDNFNEEFRTYFATINSYALRIASSPDGA